MYQQLLNLDSIRINFSAGGMHVINIVLAFVMFGVALGIRPAMFREVFTKPKSVIVGLVCQWFLLPALTFLLVVIFNGMITPMVALGMILVAACPGGNISNFITHLSRGNIELSVSMTAVTTTFATIMTPFNFALWGGLYTRFVCTHTMNQLPVLSIDFFQIFETVFILLGIPLVMGILCTKFFPRFAQRLKKPMQYASIIFFVAMIVLSFGNNMDLFMKYIFYVFFIVLVHNGMALSIGYGTASLFRLPELDRRSVTIETGIQNSGLGLVLLFNPKIFPPDLAIGGMLFVTAWWGIWHIIAGLGIATYFRYKRARSVAALND